MRGAIVLIGAARSTGRATRFRGGFAAQRDLGWLRNETPLPAGAAKRDVRGAAAAGMPARDAWHVA